MLSQFSNKKEAKGMCQKGWETPEEEGLSIVWECWNTEDMLFTLKHGTYDAPVNILSTSWNNKMQYFLFLTSKWSFLVVI